MVKKDWTKSAIMSAPKSQERPMTYRKFRQSALYWPTRRGRNAPPRGNYQVTSFLPQRQNGEPEYQIRHLAEEQEWIAGESELRSA
jgi:hypothetical protein